ncbi:MAG: hypothetical protein JOY81_02365 [Alphaproteobacteria bacterium]|nr:hypothetical protein [Alphaproteobacteria bacterium]
MNLGSWRNPLEIQPLSLVGAALIGVALETGASRNAAGQGAFDFCS